MRSGVVVFRRAGGDDEIDAIDQYSRRLVDGLEAAGIAARYVDDGLAPLLADSEPPAWTLVQYNPFRYGRAGFAPRFLREAVKLRRRWRTPLVVMVHEAWIDMVDPRSSLIGGWQRAQLRALLRLADGVMTSTEALAREVGGSAVHVPIAANVTPIPTSSRAARERLGLDGRLAVGLFGRDHPSRALDHAECAIAALAAARGADRLLILNLGAGAPGLRVPAGVEVWTPGPLTADEVSLRLWASDMVLLPLVDGVSTRRGTLMAALAHGRPVVGLRGRSTDTLLIEARDALALTPAGDPAAYARAAVELAANRARMEAIGEAGKRLYEARFDWPVLTRRVASVLDSVTVNGAGARRVAPSVAAVPTAADRREEIVFVAHDVGGPGGMERVSEQLVGRLLDDGRPVTVIARTCALAGREGLRFVRVATPRRPFTIGYPAFFIVASALAGRRGTAVLHTTGAIVGNRSDVSTVHYCHRAAATRVGSRASRPGWLYRINAATAAIESRVAEAWCYRPTRTRLLCAVSGGVASELRRGFPAMAGAVRTVPNGVDSATFRPDPAARREVRAQLGLDDRVSLALFVGGDWERKGLAYAVDALALAPQWQLAVAGNGDPSPHQARARAAETGSRLHFLGPVREMPRLYAAADAFVLPTTYEAFPLVVLEAAASGLPLLVTRVNGVEDLLRDGSGGWFITRDCGDIARRLNELTSDPELARRMSEAARAAATSYSWEAMAEGYLSLYAELAGESR